MKKKLLKRLSIGLLVAGSIAGVGYATVQAVNTYTNSSITASEPVQFASFATFSVGAKDPVTNKYTLTIFNKDASKGTVTFNDGTETAQYGIGEPITLVVDIKNPDYTVQTIKVHSQTNVDANGVGNNTVGVDKINDATYTFELPPETTLDGKPNPFYDKNPNLNVDVYWTLKKINAWEYDWMDGTDSGNYMIRLNKDFIFDDVESPNLAMKTVLDSVTNQPQANVIFRIYMEGHNMQIRNMTIPKGVQLMFINNKANTYEGKMPVVSLTKDSKFNEYRVEGAVGRWGSVDFSPELKTKLNLNVAHGWWDSNVNE